MSLEVVRVENWSRSSFFDATGLMWVNPSPNMRSLTEAILYPGIGLLETTNLSVGRGTDTPFEVVGAPWIDGRELAAHLNKLRLAGVAFVPIRFVPTTSKYQDQACGGINISIIDRRAVDPLQTGLEIARALHFLYPDAWQMVNYRRLLGNEQTWQAVHDLRPLTEIRSINRPALDEFLRRRQACLLYTD